MDQDRFDQTTKALADAGSRRRFVRGLAGAALGGLLARVAPAAAQGEAEEAGADLAAAGNPGGKGCLRLSQKCSRDGRRCCGGSRCAGGRCRCKASFKACVQRCIPAAACCTSAACGAGKECRDGQCRCLDGSKPCGDGCISVTDCCQDDDCGQGTTCQGGTCACRPGTKPCQGGCIAERACCDRDDCRPGQSCQNGACLCPQGFEEIEDRCVRRGDCPADVCTSPAFLFPTVAPAIGTCVVATPANVEVCDALPLCTATAQCRADEVCVDRGCSDELGRCARICTAEAAEEARSRPRST